MTIDLPGLMRSKQGEVSYQARQKTEESARLPQSLDFGDALRTHALSRAAVTITNGTDIYLSELTRLAIVAEADRPNVAAVRLGTGRARFISRGGPASTPFQTKQLAGINHGTEFLVDVEPDRTIVTLFSGEAELTNADTPDRVRVRSGQQGIAVAGKPIEVRVVIQAQSIVQWWIYYPAILDSAELELSPAELSQLAASLEAYRVGDLLTALKQYPGYPEPVTPPTEASRLYLAGLMLAVGAVDRSGALLSQVNSDAPLPRALRTMIEAVSSPAATNQANLQRLNSEHPKTTSELLALSHAHQAAHNLKAALDAARQAVERSPRFGFGWARVAELEFSHGHTAAARQAVEQALSVTPRNAQAHSLRGFLLAAGNHTSAAIAAFDEAIRIDPALGNAWLGRGLTKTRRGDSNGRADLRMAAMLEPERSLLRSYLGKAFAEAREDGKAAAELLRAEVLDTKDPTPWLYSALLKRDQNRIGDAVGELQKSVELNDNRAVYRSRFLLDEDRAVRSASLASVYRDAGMTDVSVREAARAVTCDYANHSAHLFLANAYNDLRDPTRFNLRYETVWFNELLLANVLAPVGAGQLSQHVSQQEYSRLFETDGPRFASSTLARSDGQAEELASLYGACRGTGYALDLDYQHHKGVRPNNDLSSIEWYSTLKQQVTPENTVMILTKYEDYHSGDNFQYYDPHNARPNFRFDEYQDPILVGAWHHEWSPSAHTLLLGGRLINEQHFSDLAATNLVLIPTSRYWAVGYPFDVKYRGEFEIYTGELNQLFQWNKVTVSAGGRCQIGSFQTQARLFNPPAGVAGLFDARGTNAISTDDGLERFTGYGYLTVEPFDQLWLSGGLAYDDLTYPRNFRQPPISSGEDHRSQLGPKAALVWSPLPHATLRGMFSRSLGGVSFDESFRLEPTQLAGFPQAFRSLISESLVSSVAAPTYQTLDLALDLKLSSRTYAGVQAERLEMNVRRAKGVFMPPRVSGAVFLRPLVPSSTDELLDYQENAFAVTVNQLLGKGLVLGASYRFTQAELHDLLPNVPVSALATADQTLRASLHHLALYAVFNHSSGFFAQAEAHWYSQDNSGYAVTLPGDHFFQENLFAGYRFAHRRAQLRVGLLNLAGQNYRLNPLTAYAELPRKRVLEASFKLVF